MHKYLFLKFNYNHKTELCTTEYEKVQKQKYKI